MKKFTVFACLSLILIFALSSFAGEFPRMSRGNSIIHGGSVNFEKAGSDTINLMAASDDPTNTANDGPCHGVEPYYDGDFEEGWNGWTHCDLTVSSEPHWNVSQYNQPNSENYAAWCGDIDIASCGGNDPDGGYGDNWHDLIEFRQEVPDPGNPSTVTVTATLLHDSELGYDFTHLSYMYQDQTYADMQSWDGTGTVAVNESVTYLPENYVDGTDVVIYWRFRSDSVLSDEDCGYPSAGGCQVDDINVRIVNGVHDNDYFEDFEHGGDPADFGPNWQVMVPFGVGDYAQRWRGLDDGDPCLDNDTWQVIFIDDNIVVPGTGGTYCDTWCYGPGGYIVNNTGGLVGPEEYIHNAIDSPVMNWPQAKDCSDLYDGIILTFSVYRHEELSPDSPGIVYNWSVRSADVDGSHGPVQDITQMPWLDRNVPYVGGPEYIREGDDVTDLMNPGRDQVQVRLSVYQIGWFWGFTGADGTPAPYFDNVTVKIFPYPGPYISAHELDLAQDNFPASGLINMLDPGSHSVRFDMAHNIESVGVPQITPGDSIVATIVTVRTGADLVDLPKLHYILDRNPTFDPHRTTGLPDQGFVTGMPAAHGGIIHPTSGKWAFDLPDTGFLFPGDVLHYYISATDFDGNYSQTVLMPADTTGFSTGFGDPMGYNSTFVFHALPSIYSDGGGGYWQTSILFINDFGAHGGENKWYTALNNLGLRVGLDYDVYHVNDPSSGDDNGIGGRATSIVLEGYDEIIYTCGDLAVKTISNGVFVGDPGDVGTLNGWLDFGLKDIFLTGDNLASDMSASGGAALAFVGANLGVTVMTHNVNPFIGSQTAPQAVPSPAPPVNPVFNTPSWIVYGGCPGINTFDGVVVPAGTSQRIAEFVDPLGTGYSFSAATLNVGVGTAQTSRVISLPYDLMYVYTDPSLPGSHYPARVRLLSNVLDYFGQINRGLPSPATPPGVAFETSNYPNPFNPSTTIKYSMPKAGHLKLSIYNVRGQLVKTMIDGQVAMGDGQIVWDGTNNQGSSVSSGVYFYEARTGGDVKIQKMTLVK